MTATAEPPAQPAATPPPVAPAPVAAPAAPAAPPVTKKSPSNVLFDNIVKKMHPDRVEKKEEPKPVEPPKVEAKVEPVKEKVEPPAEPAPKKKRNPTVKEVATATAKETAVEVAKIITAQQPKPAEAPTPEKVELPKEFAADAPAFEVLAKRDPKRYGNIVSDIASYAKKLDAYQAEWEKENPGETFDAEAADHNAWFEKHLPVDDKTLEQARTTAASQAAVAPMQEKLDRLERQQRLEQFDRQVQPEIQQQLHGLADETLTAINPEFAGVVGDAAKLKAFTEKNPLAAEVARGVFQEFAPLQAEATRIFSPGGHEVFDPKSPVHQAVANHTFALEELLLNGENTDEDGRTFATRQQFSEMSPQQRQSHWTLSKEQIVRSIAITAQSKAKQIFEQVDKDFEAKAAARGYVKPVSAPVVPSKTTEQIKTEEAAKGPRTGGSPAVSAPAPTVTAPATGATPTGGRLNGYDKLFGRLTGKA